MNVGGVTPDASGGGAIFSVTADFNGSESSVDVRTSAETYDSTAATASGPASGLPSESKTAAVGKTSPALKIHRDIRAHTVTVTIGHAKGAAGTLIVTATQGQAGGRHSARRAPRTLKVTRRKIAGRLRYHFAVRAGAYAVTATWTGTGRWADQTKTRTYRTR